jgi:hypothetical protein
MDDVGDASSLFPQLKQKAVPSAFCAPHFGQNNKSQFFCGYKSKTPSPEPTSTSLRPPLRYFAHFLPGVASKLNTAAQG